jgi:DNA modification methylase
MEAAATWEAIDSLTPWDRNPRRNDHAVEQVAHSITRFGFGSPILARSSDRVIIGGHTRFKAAQRLGLDKVPVRFLDLDPAEAAALALADNKLGELAEWDDAAVAEILGELEAQGAPIDGLGWDDEELKALLGDGLEAPTPSDDAPEVDEHGEPDSQPGAVYQLGPHRLVCGDATKEDVAVLAGRIGGLMLTDPPYSSGGWNEAGRSIGSIGTEAVKSGNRFQAGIANDRLSSRGYMGLMRRIIEVWNPSEGYIFTDWRMWSTLEEVVGSCGHRVRSMIVWDKHTPGMGMGWRTQHELACYFANDPDIDMRKSSGNVIACARSGNELHPTQKPIELMRTMLRVSHSHELVVDPFGGSGTTLMACAAEGRVARVIELDPRYCDVIRRRWTAWAVENGIDPGPGALHPREVSDGN